MTAAAEITSFEGQSCTGMCTRLLHQGIVMIALDWARQCVLTTEPIVIHMVEGVCAHCRVQDKRGHD